MTQADYSMKTEHVAAFLIAQTATAALLAVTFAFRSPRKGRWLSAVATALALALAVSASSLALPGRNSVVMLFVNAVNFDRTTLPAILAGITGGTVIVTALLAFGTSRPRQLLTGTLHVGSVALLCVILLKEFI